MLGTGNFPDIFGKNPVPGNGIRERRPLPLNTGLAWCSDPNSTIMVDLQK